MEASEEILKQLEEVKATVMLYSSEDGVDITDVRNELAAFEERIEEHFDTVAGLVNHLHDRVDSRLDALSGKLDAVEQSVSGIYLELPDK
jgi:hypothetical protein